MRFKTTGVCAQYIDYDIDASGVLHNVKFLGGCPGNGKAVASLLEGVSVSDAITRLESIDCGGRGTSCADQLAQALKHSK